MIHSVSGWLLVFTNFVIAATLSRIYIKIIEKNKLLNKILEINIYESSKIADCRYHTL